MYYNFKIYEFSFVRGSMIDYDEIKKIGDNSAQLVAQASFKIWQEKDCRKMIDFEKISQTEQDRIFNELEVSFIGLFVLHLDSLKLQINSDEGLEIISKLQTAITSGFLQIYRELKIEQKNLNRWEVLIGMRIAEYRRDFELLMKESKKMKEFEKDDQLKFVWARVETITLDCLSHIRRGKLEQKDPLRRLLQTCIVVLDQAFSKSVRKSIFSGIS